MKYLLALLAIFPCALQASTCPHDLHGTWKSDREASMAFVRAYTKLQPKTDTFLDTLYGHMTLTFTDSEVHVVMPDIEVPVAGESEPFAGVDERKPYRVLFCNSTMLVIANKKYLDDEDEAAILNFVDRDTFWLYSDGNPKVPEFHTREYFRRVAEDCAA
jgi:hypothetical protein